MRLKHVPTAITAQPKHASSTKICCSAVLSLHSSEAGFASRCSDTVCLVICQESADCCIALCHSLPILPLSPSCKVSVSFFLSQACGLAPSCDTGMHFLHPHTLAHDTVCIQLSAAAMQACSRILCADKCLHMQTALSEFLLSCRGRQMCHLSPR